MFFGNNANLVQYLIFLSLRTSEQPRKNAGNFGRFSVRRCTQNMVRTSE